MSGEQIFPARNRSSDDHADSAERAWQVFRRLLETKNLRMTKPRRIVFDEVFSRHDHFTADQLAGDFSHGERRVSRSTVYNSLTLLVEAGLVCEICDRHGRVRYEHTFGHAPHEHMMCEECGAIFEFSDEFVSEVPMSVTMPPPRRPSVSSSP